MNTRAIGTGALVAGAAGALLFISLFLDWFLETSAWKLFDLVDIWLALIAIAAIAYAVSGLVGARIAALSGPVVAALGAMAVVITLVFLFEGDERKFGIFLGLLAALGIVAGGVMAGQELRNDPAVRGGTGGGPGAGTPAPPPPPRDPAPPRDVPPPGGTPPPTA